nr:amidohydrolase family protein [Advenella kashmirensis]
MWNFARVAQLAGVTTATDLVNDLSEDTLASLAATTAGETFPLRLVPAYAPLRDPEGKGLDRVLPSIARNTDKLSFGIVKLIVDGSIQGFTARLRWPHYYKPPAGAQENGIWVIPPQQLRELIQTYHDAGLTVHIHTNGDEATDVALDAWKRCLPPARVATTDIPCSIARWPARHSFVAWPAWVCAPTCLPTICTIGVMPITR